MTSHGNHYGVDGRRSLKNRWPDADAVAAMGEPVRERKTDHGADIEQRFTRRERIVFDEDEAQDGEMDD